MTEADKSCFTLRFWGVRGSYPTPGLHTLRHGGNTACVEVQAGQHTIIFDAGTGIIRLGDTLLQRANGAERLDLALCITHGHGDHLNGFPFFAPLFDPRTHLYLFGPRLADQDIVALVTQVMSPPYFPVDIHSLPSRLYPYTLSDGQDWFWDQQLVPVVRSKHTSGALFDQDDCVRVRAQYTSNHPLEGALVYRVDYRGRSLVYATDVEWGDGVHDRFLRFIEGADILIHDAQYTNADYQQVKHGYGHSTVEMATRAARAAHVRELILFHHEPTYDDHQLDLMEVEARQQFARTSSAFEGMEIDLLGLKD